MNLRIPVSVLKMAIAWIVILLVRLIPFRAPNLEPMLAAQMPFSKRFGALSGFFFGFAGIVVYDALTSGWGIWTLVTALCYGAVGIAANGYFAHRDASAWNFVKFGVVATLLYDAATGLTIGPLTYGQTFAHAFAGQIPFTLVHLAGTILFSIVLSPVLYRWVAYEHRTVAVSAPGSIVTE